MVILAYLSRFHRAVYHGEVSFQITTPFLWVLLSLGVFLRLDLIPGSHRTLEPDVDEAQTLFLIHRAKEEGLLKVFREEYYADGPFYLILLYWIAPENGDPRARFRSVSQVAGALGYIASSLWVLRFLPSPLSSPIVFFLTFSPLHLFYSYQIRPYALAYALFWLSLLAFGDRLKPRTWTRFAVGLVLLTLAVMTHLHAILWSGFLLLSGVVREFLEREKNYSLSSASLLFQTFPVPVFTFLFVTLLGFLTHPFWHHPYFFWGLKTFAELIAPNPFHEFTEQYLFLLWDLRLDSPENRWIVGYAIFVTSFSLGGFLLSLLRRGYGFPIYLLSTSALLPFFFFALSGFTGIAFYYKPRHLIGLLPFLFLFLILSYRALPTLFRMVFGVLIFLPVLLSTAILYLSPLWYPHIRATVHMAREVREICTLAQNGGYSRIVVDFLLWKYLFAEYCGGLYPEGKIQSLGYRPAGEIREFYQFRTLIRSDLEDLLAEPAGSVFVDSGVARRFFQDPELDFPKIFKGFHPSRTIEERPCPLSGRTYLCQRIYLIQPRKEGSE
jgi:hypothetical protein